MRFSLEKVCWNFAIIYRKLHRLYSRTLGAGRVRLHTRRALSFAPIKLFMVTNYHCIYK